MSTEPADRSAADVRSTDYPPSVLFALKALRLVMILGIASLLVASATLLIYGIITTILQIVRLLLPSAPVTNRDVFLSSIKLIDLVLLATIMQVVGIGLYSLFVSKSLPVSQWLITTNIDDLKNKLAGIVAIMLGVLFLEQLFYWGSDRDLMPLGIGIAAVIVALSYFIRSHPES